MLPRNRRSRLGRATMVLAAWVLVVSACGGSGPSLSPTPTGAPSVTPGDGASPGELGPPAATPLAAEPAAPQGDGTTATIRTREGDIVIELFTGSAPVASANFIQLAEAGFYQGVLFHRIVPDFMIQGGDPTGTGSGGPGYTIVDEPFAGTYEPGAVAMARTPAPDSQGSQFFIVIGDASHLEHVYTIFGRVTAGLEVAEAIAAGPRGGPQDDQALDPVPMDEVVIQRP
jgi:cyclophilin family peptidyl-prolyl cis-trans isomerase